MMKQVISVMGGTGLQGGGVIDALLAQGTFDIRVASRTPSSEKAKALAARGVRVVKGDLSWNDFAGILNALGHDLRVVRVSAEVYDGFFPGAAELRETFQYFEGHTYFGPEHRARITAANSLVPGGFTSFDDWARAKMKPNV